MPVVLLGFARGALIALLPLAGGALLHRLLLALLRLAAALARAALRRLTLLGGRSTAWCALTLLSALRPIVRRLACLGLTPTLFPPIARRC